MNKKISVNLNVIEFSSFILSLLFIGIYLMPNNTILVRPLLLVLSAISGFIFIGIELFLLLVMNNKYRIVEGIYILISIILGVLINVEIPYSVFIVLVISSLVKAILRIIFTNKIYLGSRYKTYSKLFISEINDLKKVFIKKKKVSKVSNRRKVRSKSLAQKDLV